MKSQFVKPEITTRCPTTGGTTTSYRSRELRDRHRISIGYEKEAGQHHEGDNHAGTEGNHFEDEINKSAKTNTRILLRIIIFKTNMYNNRRVLEKIILTALDRPNTDLEKASDASCTKACGRITGMPER